jgi:MraZ protein
MDAKGRLRLPTALLKQMSAMVDDGFVVNRGFEKHLMLYPKNVWDKRKVEIDQLNIFDRQKRKVIRYFYRGASKLALDGSERISLPASLVDYAGIEKEVVLFAYQQQVEIWSVDAYEQELADEPDEFAEISEGVMTGIKVGLLDE